MDVDEASRVIIRPHATEKTFAMVERESKVCFIVKNTASKPEIAEAISIMYGEKAVGINTARTIYGKKAFVQFGNVEKARDLATKIGML